MGLSGNIAAQIRIARFDLINDRQQAGLMFRESLGDNSINFACMLVHGMSSGMLSVMNQWRECIGCSSEN